MGGPHRTTAEALDALEEAVQLMRELWQPGTVRFHGRHYTIDGIAGSDPIRTTTAGWMDLLTRLGHEQPFTTFILWPERPGHEQIQRFSDDIAPAVRANLADARAPVTGE